MIDLREYNYARIRNALVRRFEDISLKWYWLTHPDFAKQNNERIRSFKDRYKGQRCFVLGNGPSLKQTDLTKLKDEICFGANRIYLIKEDVDFEPSFIASIDAKLLAQFCDEISAQPMPKFISWKYYKYFKGDENTVFIKLNYDKKFSPDLTDYCWGGHTVTFINLQLAYYMGFSDVVIIGCDHSYAGAGAPNTDVKIEGKDENHFSDKYYVKGHTFRIPDWKNQEYAYALARDAFEKDGRRVVDATIGGKLQVFPKIDYNSLFDGKGVE